MREDGSKGETKGVREMARVLGKEKWSERKGKF